MTSVSIDTPITLLSYRTSLEDSLVGFSGATKKCPTEKMPHRIFEGQGQRRKKTKKRVGVWSMVHDLIPDLGEFLNFFQSVAPLYMIDLAHFS